MKMKNMQTQALQMTNETYRRKYLSTSCLEYEAIENLSYSKRTH